MPSTHLHSIGTTGRDYSTLQAWEDACPANLVTADEIYRGECYNDSEFTAGLTIGGMTTDATRYVELTAAAGHSFQDNANVRTNALRYNQSNGVGAAAAANWGSLFNISAGYTRVNRLQIKNTSTDHGRAINGSGTDLVKDCICVADDPSTAVIYASTGTVINCVIIALNSSGPGIGVGYGGFVLGCTIIKPSDVTAGGTGLTSGGGSTDKAQSCAVFGFTTASSGTWAAASGYNATNLASGLPGTTGNVYNVTYSQYTPLTDADKDSLDLRAVAATALAAAGYLDATNAPNDIGAYARAASPTIGAWELAAAAAAGLPVPAARPYTQAVNRAAVY